MQKPERCEYFLYKGKYKLIFDFQMRISVYAGWVGVCVIISLAGLVGVVSGLKIQRSKALSVNSHEPKRSYNIPI